MLTEEYLPDEYLRSIYDDDNFLKVQDALRQATKDRVQKGSCLAGMEFPQPGKYPDAIIGIIELLDLCEHGLVSSYHVFSLSIETIDWDDPYLSAKDKLEMYVQCRKPCGYPGNVDGAPTGTLTRIGIIARKGKFEPLITALIDIGITGMTVFPVSGCGVHTGHNELCRGIPLEARLKPKVRMEVVVAKLPVANVVNTARHVLYKGHVGEGKFFIDTLTDVVRVRTGESGYDAI